jgi:hypothetical protein
MAAFIFSGLSIVCLCLAFLYCLLGVYVYRKLLWLQAKTSDIMDTRKLFVMTCLLIAVLRVMSFASMASIDFAVVGMEDQTASDGLLQGLSQSSSRDTSTVTHGLRYNDNAFFEKAMLVLFDFPQFCCISAYVLLIVLWAEAFVKSRNHWFTAVAFKKKWMLSYFLFNVILYSAQLALYSLLLIPSIDQTLQLHCLYLTLAVFNLFLPCFWCASYIYLSFQFSGFPFSSRASQRRLHNLSKMGLAWSSARLAWGILALTTLFEDTMASIQQSKVVYSVVLILIFLVTEVFPVYLVLLEASLQSLVDRSEVRSRRRLSISSRYASTPLYISSPHSDDVTVTAAGTSSSAARDAVQIACSSSSCFSSSIAQKHPTQRFVLLDYEDVYDNTTLYYTCRGHETQPQRQSGLYHSTDRSSLDSPRDYFDSPSRRNTHLDSYDGTDEHANDVYGREYDGRDSPDFYESSPNRKGADNSLDSNDDNINSNDSNDTNIGNDSNNSNDTNDSNDGYYGGMGENERSYQAVCLAADRSHRRFLSSPSNHRDHSQQARFPRDSPLSKDSTKTNNSNKTYYTPLDTAAINCGTSNTIDKVNSGTSNGKSKGQKEHSRRPSVLPLDSNTVTSPR